MINKFKPFYSFSPDYEEIVIELRAKRVRHNYIIEKPSEWVIDDDHDIITVCGLNPPKREDIKPL